MGRRAAVLFGLALAPLLLGPGCTPAQLQAARRGAVDFALCEAEVALVPSLSGLGARLDREDWREWGSKALTGALSGAAVCGLREVAKALRADGPAARQDDVYRIQVLAERCAVGECRSVEERAAWLLWQEIRAGRLAVPASGRG